MVLILVFFFNCILFTAYFFYNELVSLKQQVAVLSSENCFLLEKLTLVDQQYSILQTSSVKTQISSGFLAENMHYLILGVSIIIVGTIIFQFVYSNDHSGLIIENLEKMLDIHKQSDLVMVQTLFKEVQDSSLLLSQKLDLISNTVISLEQARVMATITDVAIKGTPGFVDAVSKAPFV